MLITIKGSTYSNFVDDVLAAVKDPRNKTNPTFLVDLFKKALRDISDAHFPEYLHTVDYPWDQGLPNYETLLAKGDLLQSYVQNKLVTYLDYLIFLFESGYLLNSSYYLQERTESKDISDNIVQIRIVKLAYVNQILRVINFPVVDRVDGSYIRKFVRYLKDIDEGMSVENPDYSHMGNLYDNAMISATGAVTVTPINQDWMKLTDPKLIEIAGETSSKTVIEQPVTIQTLIKVESYIKEHKLLVGASVPSVVVLISLLCYFL